MSLLKVFQYPFLNYNLSNFVIVMRYCYLKMEFNTADVAIANYQEKKVSEGDKNSDK